MILGCLQEVLDSTEIKIWFFGTFDGFDVVAG